MKDPHLARGAVCDRARGGPHRQHDAGKTLLATARDGGVNGDRVHGYFDGARATMAALAELGISMDGVTDELERDGVAKFIASWHELLDTVTKAMQGS